MISPQVTKFCNNPELIENYDKAVADKEHKWHCHHRQETPDYRKCKCLGLYFSKKSLKSVKQYYKVNPEDLIFLTSGDHLGTHNRDGRNFGKKRTEESRMKISMANKNKNTGKHWYNNGVVSVTARACPEGFRPGRLL